METPMNQASTSLKYAPSHQPSTSVSNQIIKFDICRSRLPLLAFHIFGALAEFERAVIRERTKAGMAAAKARGKLAGRKPSLTPGDVKMLRALLRDPGITVVAAAKRLGVSPSTVFRYLPGGRSAVGG